MYVSTQVLESRQIQRTISTDPVRCPGHKPEAFSGERLSAQRAGFVVSCPHATACSVTVRASRGRSVAPNRNGITTAGGHATHLQWLPRDRASDGWEARPDNVGGGLPGAATATMDFPRSPSRQRTICRVPVSPKVASRSRVAWGDVSPTTKKEA